MVAAHGVQNEIAILDNYFRQTLDQATEAMRVKGNKGEQAMQQNEHQAATERGEKCRAAVDRARESTDARMTSKTASNAVLRDRDRLWPNRIMISVAINTITPRNEI